ncbi:MAG: site-specific integrase [Muribaculaceae bacterium]|nr:site-specific integrase [Muribaculaceae bacterium]
MGKIKSVSVVLRSRPRKNGRSALFLDINVDGERKMEYLKLYLTNGTSRADKLTDKETMRVAETIRAKRLLELREEGLKEEKEENKRQRMRLLPYLDSIIATKKGSTAQAWRNMRSHLLRYDPDADRWLDEVTPDWARGFRKYIENARQWDIDDRKRARTPKEIAEGTKLLMWQKFRSIFTHAVNDWHIDRNPTAGIEGFREQYGEREFLTIDELKLLIRTPMPHEPVCRAFVFSCLTGLRWSDIVALRWRDVRENNGHTRLVFTQQKTRNLEYMDISEQAVEWMGERRDADNVVFMDLTTEQAARINVTAWVKSAGIDKHITFHCGRHTFATMMLTLGVDLYTVSKLLGHRSIETTQVYARILDKGKSEAVDRIPKLI